MNARWIGRKAIASGQQMCDRRIMARAFLEE
jgi:hypothetical protein